jgi:SAM-dependent methyltransferase
MRSCPICKSDFSIFKFESTFTPPDGWTVPKKIEWKSCMDCGHLYGDGDFTQKDLDEYYRTFYAKGYSGLGTDGNIKRLKDDAHMISALGYPKDANIADFGGGGEDDISHLTGELHSLGYRNAVCVGAGVEITNKFDVIYASHVLEHIYDLPEIMDLLCDHLAGGGTFIADVPDSMWISQYWKQPILDFNTKHINHFTLLDLLNLFRLHGFTMVQHKTYIIDTMIDAQAIQAQFKRLDVGERSAQVVEGNRERAIEKLKAIDFPVNIWGMSDVVWTMLSYVDLNVLDYIDNDPAYKNQMYKGKPILEAPTNDAPIIVMAQMQRGKLIENIRKAGYNQRIIEI